MSDHSARRAPGRAYGRFLRAVVVGGALALLLGIVGLALRPASRGTVLTLDPDDPRLVAEGRLLYDQRCAACHGAQHEGQPGWQDPPPRGPAAAPPLDGSAQAWRRSDTELFRIVAEGGQAFSPPGTISAMPGYGSAMSDADIRAVLSYVKSTWPAEARTAQPVE